MSLLKVEDLVGTNYYNKIHPLGRVFETLTNLHLPKLMTVNIKDIDDFTQQYAEVWYNKHMVSREETQTQE